MAWSIVGVGTVAETTTTTLTLTEPAGVADGDLLIAGIASRTTATTAVTNTGWLPVNSQNTNNTLTTTSAIGSGTMLYQVRAGTPDLTFVIPAGVSVAMGRIVAYRGNATTTPLDVSTAFTTAINITAVSGTGLTTTQANDLIVAMAAGGQEAAWSSFNATTPVGASGATDTTTAPSATWRERADSVTTTGADTSLGVFDALKTAAGATGNLTATASLGAGHVVIAGAFKSEVTPVISLVKSAEGTSALATTTASFASAPTSGNLIVLCFSADDYNVTPNSGWTQSNEMEQQTFHGGYVWWRISDGSNSFQYTIGSATNSSWVLTEWSGIDASPYDVSEGQFQQTSASPYTTAAVTPTAGGRLLVAALGSSHSSADMSADLTAWQGGFTHIRSSGPASATGGRTAMGVAYRLVTANGSTAYSSGAAFPFAVLSKSGMTIAFKEGAGGTSVTVSLTGAQATAETGTVYACIPAAGVWDTGTWDCDYWAGTDVAVGLTGAEAIAQAGTVIATGVRNVSTLLTGAQATGQAGSVTAIGIRNASTLATGAQATGQAGTVSVATTSAVNVNVLVTGAQATGQAGTVGVTAIRNASTTATGAQATGQAGTVTVTAGTGVNAPLTGAQATGQAGTVTITAKQAVSFTLTGAQAAAQAGGVAVAAGGAISVSVSGAQATGQAGTVSITANRSVSTTLSGAAATAQAGTVGVTATKTAATLLTGAQASTAAGSVSVTAGGSITVPLTGAQATGQAGMVTVLVPSVDVGMVKVWTGSAWVEKPAKVWTGSAWAVKPVKHWSGSAWV